MGVSGTSFMIEVSLVFSGTVCVGVIFGLVVDPSTSVLMALVVPSLVFTVVLNLSFAVVAMFGMSGIFSCRVMSCGFGAMMGVLRESCFHTECVASF